MRFIPASRRLFGAVLLMCIAVVGVLAVMFIVQSWGGSSGPRLSIAGTPCTAVPNGGTLYARGSGFTPNGRYVTQAWANGRPIPSGRLHNPGRADVYGRPSGWHWTCRPPAGNYTVRITDLSTGKSAQAHFTIDRYAK